MKGSNSVLMESGGWDRVYTGFVLGESDDGTLWLPRLWRAPGAVEQWTRRFNPRNPLHWPRWWNTRRRHAFVWLERID